MVVPTPEYEANEHEGTNMRRFFDNRVDSNISSLIDRIPKDARRYGRGGDAPERTLLGPGEDLPVARRQLAGRVRGRLVHRAQRMDAPRDGKAVPRRDDRLTRRDRRERTALLVQAGPGGTMDGSSDPATRRELRVGSIHDRVHVGLRGDVSADALDREGAEYAPHATSGRRRHPR